MRIKFSRTRISWSPLPGESWHLRWRYMIPIRLPWRPRARPSATLHEIPAHPKRVNLETDTITDRAVCQGGFVAGPAATITCGLLVSRLERLERGSWRYAHGFKPAADVDLGVGFSAEMTSGGACCGGRIPFDHRELLVSTLDNKPVDRILIDNPANLTLEFFQTRHAFSGEPTLGRSQYNDKIGTGRRDGRNIGSSAAASCRSASSC